MMKNNSENTRRDAILAAALPLFLENGYEKTSIRMISNKVGCEVGLVYYYFSAKDEIFENALALYFNERREALEVLTEKTKTDATRFVSELFDYLEKESESFHTTFSGRVHWTIRTAVRGKLASLLCPCFEIIAKQLKEEIRPPYPADLAAKSASDVIAQAAFHEDAEYFKKHRDDLRRILNHLLGTDNRYSSRRREIPSFLL